MRRMAEHVNAQRRTTPFRLALRRSLGAEWATVRRVREPRSARQPCEHDHVDTAHIEAEACLNSQRINED